VELHLGVDWGDAGVILQGALEVVELSLDLKGTVSPAET
jgi:hypothetical protein